MEELKTADAPVYDFAPLSQGIIHGDTVYLSGQIGSDPDTEELVSGGIERETEQVLRNIGALLEAAGSSVAQVVKTTVFVTDMVNDYPTVNDLYEDFFTKPFPARSAIEVSKLAADARVEIEAVAALD